MPASPAARPHLDVQQVHARPGRRLAALWCTLCNWHARSCQRRQLSELEPRMLRDIGVTDQDVRREVRKPFWRP